jgi:hypothetical protein
MTQRALRVLLLSVLFSACMGYYHFGLLLPRSQNTFAVRGLGNGYHFGNDFYPLWLSSQQWLLHADQPYSPAVTRKIQTGLFGRPLDPGNPFDPPADYRAFAYPAFLDVLVLPLARLPFPWVRFLLAPFLVAITALSVVLWLRVLRIHFSPAIVATLILLTLFSYPVLEGVFALQIGLLVNFLLVTALLALEHGKQILAGALLALSTVKPQMSLLVIFCLLTWALSQWRERWPFASGLIAGLGVLYAAAAWVSPSWIVEWLRVLRHYGRYSQPTLPIDLFGAKFGAALSLGLLMLAMVVAWRIRRSSPRDPDFSTALAGLLLLSVLVLLPGQAVYDHILLLPSVLLLLQATRTLNRGRQPIRFLLVLTGLAISWQWIAALAVVTASLFVGRGALSDFWVSLPVRTAASAPFALAGAFGLIFGGRILGQKPLGLNERQCEN